MGTIDLGTTEQKNVALYVRNEVLQPIDPASLSNYKAIMPFFSEQPSLRLDGKLYAVPFTWGMQPMIYRPDMVTEVPTSAIFPSRRSTEPFVIVGPAPVMIVALRISVVRRGKGL